MLESRCRNVRAISTARLPTGPPRAVDSVAVVARGDLIVRRIRDALAGDAIAIRDHAAQVVDLPDSAAELAAIVLAEGTAGERRALLREAARRFPGVPGVVIARNSTSGVLKALEAGAAGYVVDSQIETTLGVTIRAVQAGQVAIPRTLGCQAVRPALSQREKQTLGLVVMGLTNREIAQRLFLAESTVKTHLTSIFGKLGVGSRSDAVALVLDPDQKLGLGILGLTPAAGVASGAREEGRS
jgi:DNA-binding NarL/FixJ family response regulator